MKMYYALCLLPVMALLFTSCTVQRYLYAPAGYNTPMFNKKGETHLGAYAVGGIGKNADTSHNHGYDLQAGYALTNHFALTATSSKRVEKDIFDSAQSWVSHPKTNMSYTRYMTDLGIGYFTKLDAAGTVYFNLYGGYGFDRYNMNEAVAGSAANNRFLNSAVSRFYLQPGFHFNPGSAIQLGLYGRITTAHYHNITSSYTASEEADDQLDGIRYHNYVYFEPSATFRWWLPAAPWIRMDLQASISGSISLPSVNHRALYTAAGLSIDFSRLKDGRKRHKKRDLY